MPSFEVQLFVILAFVIIIVLAVAFYKYFVILLSKDRSAVTQEDLVRAGILLHSDLSEPEVSVDIPEHDIKQDVGLKVKQGADATTSQNIDVQDIEKYIPDSHDSDEPETVIRSRIPHKVENPGEVNIEVVNEKKQLKNRYSAVAGQTDKPQPDTTTSGRKPYRIQ